MPKASQIHFEVTPKYNQFIKKYAKLDGVSLSEYYRRSAYKQAKKDAFLEKAHKFDKRLAHDNAPIIHSKKEFIKFIKWLQ